jgi:hypothetical protein
MPLSKPPLAGKPPYATDEPDSAFQNQPPQRRQRKEHPVDPNTRTSAYDLYDSYLNDDSNRNSGINALGIGFMNVCMDDDDDDNEDTKVSLPVKKSSDKPPPAPPPVASHPQSPAVIPLAAPRPGYAAPVAALNNLAHPDPVAVSPRRLQGPPMTINVPPAKSFIPNHASPTRSLVSVPSTPHPLQPPMTPILPAFARPPKSPAPRETVKFAASEPIMRGNSEDVLIPKRGEKGDDFWRRFSMVAKESNKKPPAMKESSWLRKSRSGSARYSRVIGVVGAILFLCALGAIGLRLYLTHNQSNQPPTAVGGSAGELNSSIASSSSTNSAARSSSVSSGIHPTNTVARRFAIPDTVPTGVYHNRHGHMPPHRRAQTLH